MRIGLKALDERDGKVYDVAVYDATKSPIRIIGVHYGKHIRLKSDAPMWLGEIRD